MNTSPVYALEIVLQFMDKHENLVTRSHLFTDYQHAKHWLLRNLSYLPIKWELKYNDPTQPQLTNKKEVLAAMSVLNIQNIIKCVEKRGRLQIYQRLFIIRKREPYPHETKEEMLYNQTMEVTQKDIIWEIPVNNSMYILLSNCAEVY